MISSLAYASRSLKDKSYLDMAEKSADFILSKLKGKDGKLLHSYTKVGKASIPGMLDDYAYFALGLLDLYMADFNVKYLTAAKEIMDSAFLYFWDERSGGFFMTPSYSVNLPVRQKSAYDGALPSGNSIAALDMIIMARLFADSEYENRLKKLFLAFTPEINSHYATGMLLAYDFALGPSLEIVIAGNRGSALAESMIDTLYNTYIPNRIIAFRYIKGGEAGQTVKLIPYTENQLPIAGKATAYVCSNYICKLPVTTLKDLEKLLDNP